MTQLDYLNSITDKAKDYRNISVESLQRNKHMNELEDGEVLQQRHIDAILVDFINFIASKGGVDYALYTKDLLNQ